MAAGFFDYFRWVWGWRSAVQNPETFDQLCGELDFYSTLQGDLEFSSELSGDLEIGCG